jgi:hypothetical protein
MGDWLVGNLTIFEIPGQNWMLVAAAIILVLIVTTVAHRS